MVFSLEHDIKVTKNHQNLLPTQSVLVAHTVVASSHRENVVLFIICFKIKNPPTLHSTSKIQPTTSPTFVFSVFESVRKTWGYEIKLLTALLGVVHRVF
jgi:hypothetical protein